ncbi:cytochrome P450 [Deinococcus sp.]|uniref:cytochrome P450 n=1 Tax=Deinococcus sp. TaxID=47478 RepID=UPI0025E6D22D|nr:cytochrome P450 [Deinococcus sp.]
MTATQLSQAALDIQAIYQSPEAVQNPYPLYERARQHGEVVTVPEWNAVAVFGHEEVSAVLRSPAALSGQFVGQDDTGSPLPSETLKLLEPMMLFHNGPSHARLRGLVNAAFTPRVVAEQELLVRELTRELLAAAGPGRFDLIEGLATPLPVSVISRMLGLSGTDDGKFRRWTHSVAELLGGVNASPELSEQIESDAREMRDYFRDLASELRAAPQPGLLSALAAVSMPDEEGQDAQLSSDELLANAVLLLVAGHETTSNLIGRGVLALSEQAGAWAELCAAPELPASLATNLADELLRFTSPVQLTGRVLGAPTDIGAQTFAAGTHTMLLLAAANRDPRTFAAPDQLDWQRPNAARHLAFASGPHYCLGASLARLEARVVFGELARYPQLCVLEQAHEYRPNITLRGLTRLEVELGERG